MAVSSFRQALKPWILPIAMLLGIVLHDSIGGVAFLSRYFIFVMLLITYCRVSVRELRPGPQAWVMLPAQFGGAIAAYYCLLPLSPDMAQAAFICIYCPTATAAPVVTGMLGGSVGRVATYSLISHVIVALSAPPLLSMMNPEAGIGFADSVSRIAINVLPVILGPLALAGLLQVCAPRLHSALATHQALSFYIWAFSLIIVVGNSVSFAMSEPPERIPEEIAIAALSLLLCALQFAVGRWIGARWGDKVSGAQSMGQKNTVLAIWLAMTFLHPIVSIGPAAYVAWHNSLNAWQIYRHERRAAHGAARTNNN